MRLDQTNIANKIRFPNGSFILTAEAKAVDFIGICDKKKLFLLIFLYERYGPYKFKQSTYPEYYKNVSHAFRKI